MIDNDKLVNIIDGIVNPVPIEIDVDLLTDELDVRATQDGWLDILQRLDPTRPILVQAYWQGKWLQRPCGGTGPYHTRGILSSEVVLDFDHGDNDVRERELAELKKYLNSMNWPHYICSTGGKGYHVHIFFDAESFNIPQTLGSRIKALVDAGKTVDLSQQLRKFIGDRICADAGLTVSSGEVHGIDSQKFNFSSNGMGSQIRMLGCQREDTNRTKTLLDQNGQPVPIPTRKPKLVNLSAWSGPIINHLDGYISLLERQSSGPELEGLDGMKCIAKLIEMGMPEGSRNNMALPIASLLHCAGVEVSRAMDLIDAYSYHCRNCNDQLIKGNRDTLRSRYGKPVGQDDAKTSCNKIRKELGKDFADCSACPLHTVDRKNDETANQSDRLIELAMQGGRAEYFVDDGNIERVRLQTDGHWEIMRVTALGSWLTNELYETDGVIPSPNNVSSVVTLLKAKARHRGKRYELHNRVAFHEGAIWYDLTNERHQAVKILPASDGRPRWTVEDDVPILFRREGDPAPQDLPIRGDMGDYLHQMLDLLNLHEENRRITEIEWICDIIPDIAHPADSISGPQGSGKSTIILAESRLVDPTTVEEEMSVRSRDDLIVGMANHYIVPLGNLSGISQDISDELCKGVTGGSSKKRKLYTDNEEVSIRYRCILRMNGIVNVVSAPDLLDRTFLKTVRPLPKGDTGKSLKRCQDELWTTFYKLRPFVLAEIFDIVSKAMEVYNRKDDHSNHARLSDWYAWAEIVANILGMVPEEFQALFETFEEEKHEESIGNNTLATGIVRLVKSQGYWLGTAGELLKDLRTQSSNDLLDRTMPSEPGSLGRALTRYIPDLEHQGVHIRKAKYGEISRVASKYLKSDKTYDRKDRMIFITNHAVEDWKELNSIMERSTGG